MSRGVRHHRGVVGDVAADARRQERLTPAPRFLVDARLSVVRVRHVLDPSKHPRHSAMNRERLG